MGSFLAAFLTEYLDPHYSFLICCVVGVAIVISAFKLNNSLEEHNQKENTSLIYP